MQRAVVFLMLMLRPLTVVYWLYRSMRINGYEVDSSQLCFTVYLLSVKMFFFGVSLADIIANKLLVIFAYKKSVFRGFLGHVLEVQYSM